MRGCLRMCTRICRGTCCRLRRTRGRRGSNSRSSRSSRSSKHQLEEKKKNRRERKKIKRKESIFALLFRFLFCIVIHFGTPISILQLSHSRGGAPSKHVQFRVRLCPLSTIILIRQSSLQRLPQFRSMYNAQTRPRSRDPPRPRKRTKSLVCVRAFSRRSRRPCFWGAPRRSSSGTGDRGSA